MRKIIYNKFDKKSIAELPTVTFPGKTVVVMSESEAEKAVDFLLSNDILGVDTETRPSFKKGESHMVSLFSLQAQPHWHNPCYLAPFREHNGAYGGLVASRRHALFAQTGGLYARKLYRLARPCRRIGH